MRTKPNTPKTITYKEAAALTGLSLRHLKRKAREWGLVPVGFTGNRPLFPESAVLAAQQAETARRLASYQEPAAVLTVAEAKAKAGRGAK